VVASRTAEEQAQLERERDVQCEKMRRVIDREIAVGRREKAATQKEVEVELMERTAHHTIDGAKAAARMIDDERAGLQQREVAVQEKEARLATLQADLEARTRDLKEQEAKVEGFLAEQSAGIKQVVKWVGEANTTLDTLGLSSI
jgi:S-adenosylmethionine:diacylglycerol 3-amino-3-carboxypropyl transferase